MRFTTVDTHEIREVVKESARAELLPRLNRVGRQLKPDGSILTEADLAMNHRLREQLGRRYPDIGFLSEEMPRAEQESLLRSQSGPLWCLDPLDGTTNFAAGVPLFAVSLALLENGESRLGIIYDPCHDECFFAQKARGAFLNERKLLSSAFDIDLKQAVAFVDFKRLSSELKDRLLHNAPYASQRNFGSCALEWGWMACGRGHVYLHGGQKLWDYAAGVLILSEAGGHSMTLDGEPIFKSTVAPRSVICSSDAQLFAAWRQWLLKASSVIP